MKQEIYKCKEKDLPELFEIFKEVYKANPNMVKKDYFDWQFKNTPFADKTKEYNFLIAKEGKAIQGFLGYMPIEFRFGGKVLKGCWTHNWYSKGKSAAGLTLLTKLMEEFDNRFLIGLSTVSQQIYKLYKIPFLKEMPRMIGILDRKKVSAMFDITKDRDYQILNKSENILKSIKFGRSRISFVERFSDSDEFLLNDWSQIKGYCRKTGKYLNWRYKDIPRHNYRFITDNTKTHYAVYRIEKIMHKLTSVTRIVDWNFNEGLMDEALSFIAQDSIKENSILIDFFCTAKSINDVLADKGFFNDKQLKVSIPYLFRPIFLTDGISLAVDLPPHRRERDFDFNEWYFTKGDSDIDRIKL